MPTATVTDEHQLPTVVETTAAVAVSKKLTLVPFIFMIYFEVSGGPYGEEPVVQAAGPLIGILGFLIFPFIWCLPEALITAELSTAFPGNGGFVIWADSAFGPFFGSLLGTWKFLSVVINLAAYPALCADYLMRTLPVFTSGLARNLAIFFFTLIFAFLNYTGLAIVGYFGIALGIISLAPFIIMSLIAIPHIRPHRWISLGQKGVEKDWRLYFNTLLWNLNFWDGVSAMAGEVDNPQKTFPLALLSALILNFLSYIIPLLAATGAVAVDQSEWQTGFMADAAQIISGGFWLKLFLEIGAVLSTIGVFEAQLSSSVYQLLGMADLALLPRIFARRSKLFNTPWVGIAVSTSIVIGVSYMSFSDIVSSSNFLYCLGMLLEFASFLWLRWKLPQKKRPYKVPLRLPGLVVMLLIPTGFLVFTMVIATKTVFIVSGVMTAAGIGWYFFMNLVRSKGWLRFERLELDENLNLE